MTDKLFYKILALIITIGVVVTTGIVVYSYKLQSQASVISIVSNEG